MYAIIQTGGKQYRVQPGEIVQIEKLEGDKGSSVQFKDVLFFSKNTADNSTIFAGSPFLGGAEVTGEIVGQGRGEKIIIRKMKRRKQYRRTQGHRQEQTQVLITSVSNGAGEALTLKAADKEATLSKFYSLLKPKGPSRTQSKAVLKGADKLSKKGLLSTGAKSPVAKKAAAPKTAAKKPAAKKTT